MSIEIGILVGLKGEQLHWHLPPGRTSVYLPDSPDLWARFWEHRNNLAGFAHSHPGSGRPFPSTIDLSTFSAIEAGLGRRLTWWILNTTSTIELRWCGPHKDDYRSILLEVEPLWTHRLRQLSYTEFTP